MNKDLQIGTIVIVEGYIEDDNFYGLVITEPQTVVFHGSLTSKKMVNMAMFETLEEAKTIQNTNEHYKFFACYSDGLKNTGEFNDYLLFYNL